MELLPHDRLHALSVLLVEDEPDVAAMFSDLLRELGVQPRLASTAEAALQEIERERPDAIILDLRLPGMSGRDFLRLSADSGIPIVVVSGVATEAEARECLRLGAIDFLPKPVTLERLSLVLSFLDLHTLKRDAGRRRLPRAAVTIPIQVGAAWQWTSLDLSPLGIKIPPQVWLSPGAQATLMLALPDGEPPLQVEAVFTHVPSAPGKPLNVGRALRVAIAMYRSRRTVQQRYGFHEYDRAMPVPEIFQVRCLETDELFEPAACNAHTMRERASSDPERAEAMLLASTNGSAC